MTLPTMTLNEIKRISLPDLRYRLLRLLFLGALLCSAPSAYAEQRYVDLIFAEVNVQPAVPFGSGTRDGESPQTLLMDIYTPAGDLETRRPAIVLAFPGGFVDGARDNPEMVELASQFARRGYVAASIDYRLIQGRPNSSGEVQVAIVQAVHDMRAAVRFLREDGLSNNEFGTDGKTILVGGISAGAVMAAVTAVLDDGDDLPSSVREYLETSGGMAGDSSTNTSVSSDVSGVLQISGAIRRLSWIEPGDPPIYAAHEEFDPVVPCGTLPGIAFVEFGLALTSSGACDMIPAARDAGIPTEFFLDENALSHVSFSNSEYQQILDDSAAFFFNEVLEPRTLVSAVLPSSRSVQVGQTATVFASLINASNTDAVDCAVAPMTSVPGSFSYQRTDAANALLGSANVPFGLSAGTTQPLILSFEPDEAFAPTDVFLEFKCAEGTAALGTLGLNSVLLGAETDPVADVIGLTTVVDLQAIENVTALFAVGSANVGSQGEINVSVDDGGAGLPLQLAICETDSQSGACISDAEPEISISYEALTTRSFAVFATPTGAIENRPATHRVFVRFNDAVSGVARGATSTAIRTP